jgi:Rrf2 family protein
MAYLALKDREAYTLNQEVNQETGVPRAYLSKIFQILVQKGILKSRRGPDGGFNFNKDPNQVYLMDIVLAIEHINPLASECMMGLEECDNQHACFMHEVWTEFKDKMAGQFQKISIYQVAEKISKSKYRGLNRVRLMRCVKPDDSKARH